MTVDLDPKEVSQVNQVDFRVVREDRKTILGKIRILFAGK